MSGINPIKTENIKTKSGTYQVTYRDTDGNRNNYEKVSIMKYKENPDGSLLKGDTFELTGLYEEKADFAIPVEGPGFESTAGGKMEFVNGGKKLTRFRQEIIVQKNGFNRHLQDKRSYSKEMPSGDNVLDETETELIKYFNKELKSKQNNTGIKPAKLIEKGLDEGAYIRKSNRVDSNGNNIWVIANPLKSKN